MATNLTTTGRLPMWLMGMALGVFALQADPVAKLTHSTNVLWSQASATASPAVDVLVLAAQRWF